MPKSEATTPPMRIKSIEVKNFKSLVDFKLDLAKFTCLIGLNGAGKSTVLQFMDFLARLVRGDMEGWLEERGWKPKDMRSKLISKRDIEFCIGFSDDTGKSGGSWKALYSPYAYRCLWERLDLSDFTLEVARDLVHVINNKVGKTHGTELATGNPPYGPNMEGPITFKYQGSILSALKDEALRPSLIECKKFFQHTESLDMLTPERLRQRTRTAQGSLGHGGRNLSAFIYELGPEGRVALAKRLKPKYRQLLRVYATQLRSGWKQLRVTEAFDDGDVEMRTDATQMNDGLLRVIAILAELASRNDFLLFDEIENGINPELIEFLTDALVQARQQVLVTTHSPMILNYLEDDVAKESVMYLYKTKHGHTKSVRFFSIASQQKKLAAMGPGEVFADTDLTRLAEDIAAMPEGGV